MSSTPPPAEPNARLYSRGTPVRNVRLDDDRWAAITERAARTGSTASDVMRDALDAYLDRRP
jgi:predicted transcriptional regulator